MNSICENTCSGIQMLNGECLCYNMALMDGLGIKKPLQKGYCIQCNQPYFNDELISLNDGSVICINCKEKEDNNNKSEK